MKLPKLYSPVNIEFNSLRLSLGANLGVMEVDRRVVRRCRRVATEDGWKWQIINSRKIAEYDYAIETDITCLDDVGMDMESVSILPKTSKTDEQGEV